MERHLTRTEHNWLIAIPADETKTKQPIAFDLPEMLLPWLERYLSEVRVLFPGAAESTRLWMGKDGVLTDQQSIGDRITRLTRRLFGTSINPHLLRDCAASSLANDSVEMAQAAPALLGHRHRSTTEKLLHPGRQSRGEPEGRTPSRGHQDIVEGPDMTRAAIYARYSSENQRDESIEDQIEVCRRYAARLGFEVTATFNDRAISGSNNNRPGYQQMLAEARRGSFDVVIVEAVDRLARKLADIAGVHDELSFHRASLHAVNVGAITTMHVGMLGTMAQIFLSDLRSEDQTRPARPGAAGQVGGRQGLWLRRRRGN